MTPIIVVSREQLRVLAVGPAGLYAGMAFESDRFEVIHAFTALPPYRSAGGGLPCLFIVGTVPPGGGDLLVEARQQLLKGGSPLASAEPLLVIWLPSGSQDIGERCVLLSDGGAMEGAFQFVPSIDELYSRTRGILETDTLRQKTVAIVGLGSGGAAVAVELAKSGVGGFMLYDYDRLELGNICRHACGIVDLGRRKTAAVRDAIWQKNPFAAVQIFDYDISEEFAAFRESARQADLLIGATDNNRSRFNINAVAVESGVVALFGRALTRAVGGDVVRVRPGKGPCLSCIFSQDLLKEGEEQSQFRQARSDAPAYVSDADVAATVQPGLATDIAPISNMVAKLALMELSRGTPCLATLREDLVADFYIWANRRERAYAGWAPLGYSFGSPSVLRWYGARVERDMSCLVCGHLRIGEVHG